MQYYAILYNVICSFVVGERPRPSQKPAARATTFFRPGGFQEYTVRGYCLDIPRFEESLSD